MKHIVNIAFDFDDERVRKYMAETVEQKVLADIKADVIDDIFEKHGWGANSHADPKSDPIQYWVREMVKDMLNEVKEDLCKQAASEIADRLVRSAKFRERIVGDVNGTN